MLLPHLPSSPGFFVEAGANDGFSQSNTYYLERFHGWTGLLVEPVRELYEDCVKERPNSSVYNCALVADSGQESVTMYVTGLMSLVEGARKSIEADERHANAGAMHSRTPIRVVEVEGRTLSSLLDEIGATCVDLLVLDVEGYELRALQGLDLARHAPGLILVEATFETEVDDYLRARYELVERLSRHDLLYKLR